MEQLYSLKRASEVLNLAQSTIYRFISEGYMECTRVGKGKRIRFTEKQITDWVAKQNQVKENSHVTN
jgi:excisionase family DNA binding protein